MSRDLYKLLMGAMALAAVVALALTRTITGEPVIALLSVLFGYLLSNGEHIARTAVAARRAPELPPEEEASGVGDN
jgi:hypothetical protein